MQNGQTHQPWLDGFAPKVEAVCWYCGDTQKAESRHGVLGYLCNLCRAWGATESGAAQALFEEVATRILETDWPDGAAATKTATEFARWLAYQKHFLSAGEKPAPWVESPAGQARGEAEA